MSRGLNRQFLASQVVFIIFVFVSYFFRHEGLSFFDASDFATAIQGWGIPHAPGYPLYVFLGKFVYSFIKDPFDAQFWVNIFAAWVASVFLFLTLAAHRTSALLAVLFLFSQSLFQQYILIPEVFTLNLALVAMLVYFHKCFDEKLQLRYVFGIGLVYGLGFCHHHLLALMVPASAYLLFRGLKKTKWLSGVGLAAAGFAIGLIPLVYFFMATRKDPAYTYFSVNTLNDLLFVVLRQGYGTFKMTGTGDMVSAWEIAKLIFTETFKSTFGIGLLGGLAALPFYWRSRRPAPAPTILVATTLGIFVLAFCLMANFPVDNLEGRNAFIRYLSFPCFLLLYPLAFGFEWLSQRWGQKVFVVGSVTACLIAIYSFSSLNYRHYSTVDFHVEQAYASIQRVFPARGDAGIDPLYNRCIIFAMTDPHHFGGRYYNEFKTTYPCYFFSIATVITGQFQARSELRLVQEILGGEYVLDGKTREQVLLDLFTRSMSQGYRVFAMYPGDLNIFRKPDLKVTPVGNILELIPDGAKVSLEQVAREHVAYLDSLKVLLTNLEQASIQPKAVSESAALAPFANLDIYSQLVKPSPEVKVLEDEIRERVKRFAEHIRQ